MRQYARRHRLPLDRVASAVVGGVVDDAGCARRAARAPTDPRRTLYHQVV
ncbi:hypothetical protein ACFZCU_36060 [Streptomyces canus]